MSARNFRNALIFVMIIFGPLTNSDACSLDSIVSCPLGGTVVGGGAVFRVWAPGVEAASLQGDFSEGEVKLVSEGPNGIFSAGVEGAQAGQTYFFSLLTHETPKGRAVSVNRLDPAGRALNANATADVLVDPGEFSWPASPFRRPQLNSAVIYELHVGSFNPVAPATWGTYSSVVARLDTLAALGINFIELMPLQQSASALDWGYGVSLPNTLEPSYGSPDELRQLVAEAHRRGIGVLLDVVHNHYSENSSLVCWAGDCRSDWGSYFYSREHGETMWGPRPDFAQLQVRNLIGDGISRWIEEYRVDGFRWDAVPYITKYLDWNSGTQTETMDGMNPNGIRLMQEINQLSHRSPGLISIAEDFEQDVAITQPVESGGLGFDAHWTGFFPVVQAITEDPGQIDIENFARALSGPSDRVVYTESHDEVGHPPQQIRIPLRLDQQNPGSLVARKRSLLGAVFVMTVPGVPMIFQGQEFLENQSFNFPHGTPLDWQKAIRYKGIWRAYRDLIGLRKNTRAHSAGLAGSGIEVYHRNNAAKVVAYRRWDQSRNGNVVVVANLGAQKFAQKFGKYRVGLPAGGTWNVVFSSDDKNYSADFAGSPSQKTYQAQNIAYDSFKTSIEIELSPFTAIILTQSRSTDRLLN